MKFLEEFRFPNGEQEFDFFLSVKRQCYTSFYPFQILSRVGLERLVFEPVTILYGGNGSGKTTALNVIAEKVRLQRESLYNRSNFFEDYVKLCDVEMERELTDSSCIITSDDVFDYMLTIRNMNQGIDGKREELFEDYLDSKYAKFQMNSLEDYDQLKKVNQSRRFTQSKFVRENLIKNIREQSNGESAFRYFTEKITENGLYLLDEPENSLSPERQLELLRFIEDSARFYGCQFVISTHSPFLLSMPGAKIYDLDEQPVQVKKWTQLKNVRTYFDFFHGHRDNFGV